MVLWEFIPKTLLGAGERPLRAITFGLNLLTVRLLVLVQCYPNASGHCSLYPFISILYVKRFSDSKYWFIFIITLLYASSVIHSYIVFTYLVVIVTIPSLLPCFSVSV